jgi:hypothetical protein
MPYQSIELISGTSPHSNFSIPDYGRYLNHDKRKINIPMSRIILRLVDPTEPSSTSPPRQPVQGIINEPQFPNARASSQSFLVEQKPIWFNSHVKGKSNCMRWCPYVEGHHSLSEVVIHLHDELESRMIVFKRQFVSRTPFGNTKQCQVKDLKDLSCMWYKSYDSHPCITEKTDHIICGKFGQTSKSNKIR